MIRKTRRAPSDRGDRSGRKPLISGNWKMHLNHLEAIQAVQKLSYALKSDDYRHADVSLHPPFTALRSVQTVLQADRIPISLGAQDCHTDDSGAFTGEVSPLMLSKLDVSYVIVGHSERRAQFSETDELVSAKAGAVLRQLGEKRNAAAGSIADLQRRMRGNAAVVGAGNGWPL